MLQKQTYTMIVDNTGVKWAQIFQIYGGSTVKSSRLGFFLKGSAKVVKPPRIVYKGLKVKIYRKGFISKMINVTVVKPNFNSSLIYSSTFTNNCILLKKKKTPRSKYIFGISFKALGKRKFINLFKVIY